MAVVYPLRVSYIFSRKRCLLIIGVLFAYFGSTSTFFHFGCITFNPEKHYCRLANDIEHHCHTLFKVFVFYNAAVASWIPSILGIIFNLLIITTIYRAHNDRKKMMLQVDSSDMPDTADRAVKRSLKQRKSLSGRSKEKQITLLLLALSLKFVILTLPFSVFELFRRLDLIKYIVNSR